MSCEMESTLNKKLKKYKKNNLMEMLLQFIVDKLLNILLKREKGKGER